MFHKLKGTANKQKHTKEKLKPEAESRFHFFGQHDERIIMLVAGFEKKHNSTKLLKIP